MHCHVVSVQVRVKTMQKKILKSSAMTTLKNSDQYKILGSESARMEEQCFSIPTTSESKKFKQIRL